MRHEADFKRADGVVRAGRSSAFAKMLSLAISLVVHTVACLAAMIMNPPSAPPPPPEPMALMVQFVSDPAAIQEPQPEMRKGDRQSSETVSFSERPMPTDDPVDPTKSQRDAPPLAARIATLPVPMKRPQTIARTRQVNAPVKGQAKIAKGREDARRTDVHDTPSIDEKSGLAGPIGEETMKGVTRDLAAEDRWKQLLQAHLDRRKRYPTAALSRHQEGVVVVGFTVAADGSVADVEIKQTSNVPALDQEALDLVHRASPVPAPPPNADRAVVAPINFSMRK